VDDDGELDREEDGGAAASGQADWDGAATSGQAHRGGAATGNSTGAAGRLGLLWRLGVNERREREWGSGVGRSDGGARCATVDCGDGLSPGELRSSI
jgi:hypothetical protein